MTLAPQVRIAVSEASQAGEARRVATRMAEAIGFDEHARGEVAMVATELATNLARHARDGRLLIQALDLPGGPTVEMLSVDAGPGMADVPRCLRDGYSTAGTPGNGLGAVRRLSSDFDVHSTAGAGTVVLSRLCRPAAGPAAGSRRRRATSAPPSRFRRRTRRSAATPGGSPSATGTARCWWPTASATARSPPRPRRGPAPCSTRRRSRTRRS